MRPRPDARYYCVPTDTEIRDSLHVLHEEHNEWPACWKCGEQVREPWVALGRECSACHELEFDRVMAAIRPFLRELPDEDDETPPVFERIGKRVRVLRFASRGLPQ